MNEIVEPSESKKIKLENIVPSEEDLVGLSTVEASEQIDLGVLYNLVFGEEYEQMINRS